MLEYIMQNPGEYSEIDTTMIDWNRISINPLTIEEAETWDNVAIVKGNDRVQALQKMYNVHASQEHSSLILYDDPHHPAHIAAPVIDNIDYHFLMRDKKPIHHASKDTRTHLSSALFTNHALPASSLLLVQYSIGLIDDLERAFPNADADIEINILSPEQEIRIHRDGGLKNKIRFLNTCAGESAYLLKNSDAQKFRGEWTLKDETALNLWMPANSVITLVSNSAQKQNADFHTVPVTKSSQSSRFRVMADIFMPQNS